MKIEKYIEIINFAENLKNNTRHSWTSTGRRESVAEHSWRLSVMAYFIKDEFPDIDLGKLILMCIFHDLGEAITGDIPSFEKKQEDSIKEEKELYKYLDTLPQPYKKELKELFDEMIAMETFEAKLHKALDKMEAVIQHNSSDLSTWIPLEYSLNQTYGEKECQMSKYTAKLRQYLKETTVKKIADDEDKKI